MAKLNIKSAVGAHSKISLNSTHLTTTNFGQITPVFNMATIPGDKITIDVSQFSRMSPLYVPTYGKASLKTAAYYVPYHQVAEDSDAFLAGKTVWQGQVPSLRWILLRDLMDFFMSVSESVLTDDPDALFDFQCSDGGRVVRYRFSSFGRYCFKVLRSLGYQIPMNADMSISSEWYLNEGAKKINMMPLLCFAKAYNDYMSQQQRFNTSQLSDILLKIRQNKDVQNVYTASSRCLTYDGLFTILNHIRLCYEGDMFTSAWASPNAPLNAGESSTIIEYPTNYLGEVGRVGQDNNNTYINLNGAITQRALDFLSRFDAWVRRNNYSGSKDVQQIFARFGIKSDEYRTHYAHMIGESSSPLQIGDVTSTAQTDMAQLGDYAGKGIVNGGTKFHVEAADFGQVIVLAWIAVKPMYADGFDYEVLKSDALEYYNPEFDGVGVRAIPVAEVGEYANLSGGPKSMSVFGFTERYNEYRNSRDRITGDFCLPTENNGEPAINPWHFNRDLSELRIGYDLKAQDAGVVSQLPFDSEYNRIFNVPDVEGYARPDNFYVTYNFGIEAIRPIKNASEVTNLGDGNLTIQKNGDVVA